MAELPEVVVAKAGHGAQLFGVGAVVVVEADTGAPRVLVLNLQIDVHGPRALTFAHQRHDLAARGFVELRQLALDLGEVRDLAFFQRRDVVADVQRRIVFGANHPHPADLGFADLQVDDAVGHRLLRQFDEHRLVAALLIGLLQRIAGAFDVAHGLLRAEKRVHRLFNGPGIEHGVAAHEVFVDVHQTLRRSAGGGLVGERWLSAGRHQQPAPQRQP